VPVCLPRSRRLVTRKLDVDRFLAELDLPVDVFPAAFDEIILGHDHIVAKRRARKKAPNEDGTAEALPYTDPA
jgi:hypothetical protein